MTWHVSVKQLQALPEEPETLTGRFHLTATSDEDGGGPWGDRECTHATREEAAACEHCDEYVAEITGFPSRKKRSEEEESRDRAEYERLKAKYEGNAAEQQQAKGA